ncbi:TA system VapC family ribonuclease toxin [Pseudonocardia sp. MH-G8]|uniref:TA system VapC family ribonuclease toxin n=1 Tax=Pseudonocardia sp. MH-G8 TaxID=1854588 RepID=UPI000BA10E60|nr:TA system VapC family ribonuclease toxin [Pseudonocardia sp. MH-G8]OZM79183.1 VapC toxin family PIN domain ribonuclease [Pseudonocardia sp. MH-G8]
MRALLDINVLLALLDSDHVDHRRARAWLDEEIDSGWASCAITQNGFVRIVSQPRYPSPVPPAQAVRLLQRACATPHHEFWPCDVSLLDDAVIDRNKLHGPRQVTDTYLLALAVRHGGRFITFDCSVVLAAVPAATPENLAVLA